MLRSCFGLRAVHRTWHPQGWRWHSQLLEDAKLKACRTIACKINSETNGPEMIVAVVQVAVLGLCY